MTDTITQLAEQMFPQRPAQPPRLPAICGKRQVLCYGHVCRCATEWILKDAANEHRPLVLVPLGDIRASAENCARIDAKGSGQRSDQDGFTRTVRAEDD